MRADINRYEDPWTAELYDFQFVLEKEDIPFWTELALEANGPVLELACGTGRIALPLVRAGVDLTGLDISSNMLSVAKRKLEREPAEMRDLLHLVQENMCDFKLEQEFSLIFIPFHSFQALLERSDQRDCLNCCRRHLKPDGLLAISVFNPKLSAIINGKNDLEPDEFLGPDNCTVRSVWHSELDHANQMLTANVEYDCKSPAGEVTHREHWLKLRYFFRYEIEWMLEVCGLQVDALYGDFDKSLFQADSPKMIFVAKKKS